MKNLRKRMLSLLLALLVMLLSMENVSTVFATALPELPVTEQAEESETEIADEPVEDVLPEEETVVETVAPDHRTYDYEGYQVTFAVGSKWGNSYNGSVTISNTGSEAITDWVLTFDLPDTINSIWNAKIESHDVDKNIYVIKNDSWNRVIPAGGSVSFGFEVSLTGSGIVLPESFSIPTARQPVTEERFSVVYTLGSDWGSGFDATVKINNLTDTAVEDWVLEFDFSREITSIWEAKIIRAV